MVGIKKGLREFWVIFVTILKANLYDYNSDSSQVRMVMAGMRNHIHA